MSKRENMSYSPNTNINKLLKSNPNQIRTRLWIAINREINSQPDKKQKMKINSRNTSELTKDYQNYSITENDVISSPSNKTSTASSFSEYFRMFHQTWNHEPVNKGTNGIIPEQKFVENTQGIDRINVYSSKKITISQRKMMNFNRNNICNQSEHRGNDVILEECDSNNNNNIYNNINNNACLKIREKVIKDTKDTIRRAARKSWRAYCSNLKNEKPKETPMTEKKCNNIVNDIKTPINWNKPLQCPASENKKYKAEQGQEQKQSSKTVRQSISQKIHNKRGNETKTISDYNLTTRTNNNNFSSIFKNHCEKNTKKNTCKGDNYINYRENKSKTKKQNESEKCFDRVCFSWNKNKEIVVTEIGKKDWDNNIIHLHLIKPSPFKKWKKKKSTIKTTDFFNTINDKNQIKSNLCFTNGKSNSNKNQPNSKIDYAQIDKKNYCEDKSFSSCDDIYDLSS